MIGSSPQGGADDRGEALRRQEGGGTPGIVEKTGRMKNPPHLGRIVRQECIEPLGLTVTESRIKGGSLYDGKAINTIEAVSHIGRPRILTGGSPRSHEQACLYGARRQDWHPRCRILSGDQSVASAFMAAGR